MSRPYVGGRARVTINGKLLGTFSSFGTPEAPDPCPRHYTGRDEFACTCPAVLDAQQVTEVDYELAEPVTVEMSGWRIADPGCVD